MAKGRMINNKITSDKRINDLMDDTSRLAFTWLITFADIDGRTHGDPAMVRSILFPRRTDITYDQMASYIQEWAESGLIIWYEADGDQWIQFAGFDKNQNLRRDREPISTIPAPYTQENDGVMPEQIQQDDGVMPEQIPVKLKEEKLKRREVKEKLNDSELKSAAAAVSIAYEENIGLITPMIADELRALFDDYPSDWTVDAIKEAAKNNVRKMSYILAILKNWQANGRTNGAGKKKDVKAADYVTGQYAEFIDH